jgi:5'-nucleotidase
MTAGENGEPIQSTGTAFSHVGVIVIDNEKKAIVDNYLVSTAGMKTDEAVAAKAADIMKSVDTEYGAVFAETAVRLNGDRDPGNRTQETNLGDLITDAMVWSVVDAGGISEDMLKNVVGITNGGGIRASIEAGGISKKDINTVLPFGNTVAVIYVKGSELLEALEASTFSTPKAIGGYPQTSGITWTIDTTKEYAQGEIYKDAAGKESSYYGPASINRVTIESVNNEAFDPEATYVVVTNNFCAAGGDTYNVFMRAYNDKENPGFDTGIPMDEAVMDYIYTELNAKIGESYAEPRGSETQIREAANNAA